MKDLFEDFVTLRWVKWTKRKPDFNGSVTIRFNGKTTVNATVHDKEIVYMEGDKISEIFLKKYVDSFYWMEEIVDSEGYTKYSTEIWDFKENLKDGVYSSMDTDKLNSNLNCFGYFMVEDGEITAIGEERGREGGWTWFNNSLFKPVEIGIVLLKEWPKLYELAQKIISTYDN